MIQIKPVIDHQSNCPYCGNRLTPKQILWQGIHVCVETVCDNCNTEIIEDLPIGQAIFTPYQVDLKINTVFGNEEAINWFGAPLLNSLQDPRDDRNIVFKVEKLKEAKRVIILNCVDFLYGHAFLKLLNADMYLGQGSEYDLVVIIPTFLRWMVPSGVAEIWTVNIPLSLAQNYYPQLNQMIKQECDRFDVIFVSLAHSHPKQFNITHFTGVKKHDFKQTAFRITFIWREDRLWCSQFLGRIGKRLKLTKLLLQWQNFKIRRLFSGLYRYFSQAKFTVAGLGTSTKFPDWIEDKRVDQFTPELERSLCQVYSESRLVIGLHGSNMLLPSAHAGMTLDLMPNDRWGNLAQDILYQPNVHKADDRMISFKFRYFPLELPLNTLTVIATSMIQHYPTVLKYYEVPEIDQILDQEILVP